MVLSRVQRGYGLAVVLEANLARLAALAVFVALVSGSVFVHTKTISHGLIILLAFIRNFINLL
jgi:hypothetical protein